MAQCSVALPCRFQFVSIILTDIQTDTTPLPPVVPTTLLAVLQVLRVQCPTVPAYVERVSQSHVVSFIRSPLSENPNYTYVCALIVGARMGNSLGKI